LTRHLLINAPPERREGNPFTPFLCIRVLSLYPQYFLAGGGFRRWLAPYAATAKERDKRRRGLPLRQASQIKNRRFGSYK
jgi:hypothetical protein